MINGDPGCGSTFGSAGDRPTGASTDVAPTVSHIAALDGAPVDDSSAPGVASADPVVAFMSELSSRHAGHSETLLYQIASSHATHKFLPQRSQGTRAVGPHPKSHVPREAPPAILSATTVGATTVGLPSGGCPSSAAPAVSQRNAWGVLVTSELRACSAECSSRSSSEYELVPLLGAGGRGSSGSAARAAALAANSRRCWGLSGDAGAAGLAVSQRDAWGPAMVSCKRIRACSSKCSSRDGHASADSGSPGPRPPCKSIT